MRYSFTAVNAADVHEFLIFSVLPTALIDHSFCSIELEIPFSYTSYIFSYISCSYCVASLLGTSTGSTVGLQTHKLIVVQYSEKEAISK